MSNALLKEYIKFYNPFYALSNEEGRGVSSNTARGIARIFRMQFPNELIERRTYVDPRYVVNVSSLNLYLIREIEKSGCEKGLEDATTLTARSSIVQRWKL